MHYGLQMSILTAKICTWELFILQGVLIVGERGTGKTSLAMAIAAEAKVPVVEIKAQQLEAGMWVGQSASNVRELFQTARDLVILFKPP